MLSKDEIEDATVAAEWFVKYQRQYKMTDSARAMEKAFKALIPCGFMELTACGVLDTGNNWKFRTLIQNELAMEIAGRMFHWGDSVEDATAKAVAKANAKATRASLNS